MTISSNGTKGTSRKPVVCLTGASRGIGEALAQSFAKAGSPVILLARSEAIFEVAEAVRPDAPVFAAACDVSKYGEVEKAIEEGVRQLGPVEVLVNAAAVLGSTGEIWQSDPAEWAAAIEANLLGTYNCMRVVLPAMIEARRGKIINFAGGGAAYGYPRFSAYASSKVAVVRLTETVAAEAAPYNVQVNVIAPGAIETEMLKAVRRAGGEVRSLGTMDQPVALVQFLASPESNHVSGRFIHAKDDYRSWQSLDESAYTLRRVQP